MNTNAVRGFRRGWGLAVAALALAAVAAFAGFVQPGRAGAQDTPGTPVPGQPPSTVNVNGHGRVTVRPDTASVVVGIDVLRPTLAEAQAEATAQMTGIIDAIKAAGIPEDDIQTVNYSVNIIRDYDQSGNPAEVRGFQVSNQVNMKIRDLDQVGDILDTVVAEGANNIWGISFYVDDPTAAASQAREMAVRDARTKANELAAAAGMTVGRIISISEGFSPPPAPEMFAAGAGMAQDSASVPIQTGTSEVIVDVQISFELT